MCLRPSVRKNFSDRHEILPMGVIFWSRICSRIDYESGFILFESSFWKGFWKISWIVLLEYINLDVRNYLGSGLMFPICKSYAILMHSQIFSTKILLIPTCLHLSIHEYITFKFNSKNRAIFLRLMSGQPSFRFRIGKK